MLPVKCNQHPWMKMYINVVKNPFYAVTDKSGKYEIKGLPPGDYTIAFVQEKLASRTRKSRLGRKKPKPSTRALRRAASKLWLVIVVRFCCLRFEASLLKFTVWSSGPGQTARPAPFKAGIFSSC